MPISSIQSSSSVKSNFSKEQPLPGCMRAQRSFSMFKVRRGGCEEIPVVQGKEQQLNLAGAAVLSEKMT